MEEKYSTPSDSNKGDLTKVGSITFFSPFIPLIKELTKMAPAAHTESRGIQYAKRQEGRKTRKDVP